MDYARNKVRPSYAEVSAALAAAVEDVHKLEAYLAKATERIAHLDKLLDESEIQILEVVNVNAEFAIRITALEGALRRTLKTIKRTDKAFMKLHRDVDNYEILGDAVMASRKVCKQAAALLGKEREEDGDEKAE